MPTKKKYTRPLSSKPPINKQKDLIQRDNQAFGGKGGKKYIGNKQ